MITTGSKFFLGLSLYGFAAAIAYALASDNEFLGMVLLATLGVAALFLGGLSLAFRDGNVATAAYPDGLPEGVSTIGRGPLVSASLFPALGAFGAVLLVLGMVFDRWMVWAGTVVLVAAIVEWTVQSWSDRASDDAEYNRELRRGLMHPFEFPVLGLLGAGLIVFGFSRLMLTLTKNASVVVFILVAVAVLVIAGIMAGTKRIGGEVILATLMVGGIIVLTAGVISAVYGERGFEQHAPDAGHSGETVANTADIVARFQLSGDQLVPGVVHIPRAVPTSVTFTNNNSEKYRLVVEGDDVVSTSGEKTTEKKRFATPFVAGGQTTFLTFQIDTPGAYAYYAEPEGGGARVEGTIEVS